MRFKYIAAAGLAVVILGLWFTIQQNTKSPEIIEKLTLAVYAGDVSALVYVAKEKGFFKKHGLEVALKEFEAGKLAVDTMLTGGADVATAGELVFITNLDQNPDLRIFSVVSDFRIDELIARRDKGISRPKDLHGKKVGVLKKATSEYFLGRYLAQNGLTYADVEVAYLTPSGIVDSLLKGDIDAGQTWDPNIYRLKQELGTNAVSLLPNVGLEPTETFVLMARDAWLSNHPEAARRLLLGLRDAEEFVNTKPEEANTFIANRFDLDAAYVTYVTPKINFEVTLPQRLIVVMEDETRWAMRNKLITMNEIPDYLDFFNLKLLREIDPGVVSIVK